MKYKNDDLQVKIDSTLPVVEPLTLHIDMFFKTLKECEEFNKSFINSYSVTRKYIDDICGKDLIFDYSFELILLSDFNTLSKKIVFGESTIISSLCRYLNIDKENHHQDDIIIDIKKEIKNLRNLTTYYELPQKFPNLYDHAYIPFFRKKQEFLKIFGCYYEDYCKKSRSEKREILRNAKNNNKNVRNVERVIYYSKLSSDFNFFKNEYAEFFTNMIDNLDVINKYFQNHPIELSNIDKNEFKKFDLLFAYEYLTKAVQSDDLHEKNKNLLYVDDYFLRNQNENDNDLHVVIFDLLMTPAHLNEVFVEQKNLSGFKSRKFLKENIDGKNLLQINTMFNDYIDDVIIKALNEGSENVEKSEIQDKIDEIEYELNSYQLDTVDYLKKKHQLQKLNMVLKEIPPKAIQKGIGVFKDFYVYYYHNGMVAIDKIDYGARLFVMPVSVYKNILDHNISSLRKIGNLDGISAFKHDDRTDWLLNAKKAILNGNEKLTEIDLKINDMTVSWDFTYTDTNIDKLEELLKEIENNDNYTNNQKTEYIVKIKKKKQEQEEKFLRKKQQAKQNDLELISSNPSPFSDMTGIDHTNIKLCEEQLNDEFGDEADFQELYDKVKVSGVHYKRNPAVAKYTKDRTKDADGNYHCEMCGDEYWNEIGLESHHLIPISKNGPDNIYNTVCLCVRCHTIIHKQPELLTKNIISKLLKKIEKYMIEDTPEYKEIFDDYVNNNFASYNDRLYYERQKIRNDLEQNGMSYIDFGFDLTKEKEKNEYEEFIQNEIDQRIKPYEEELNNYYQKNSNEVDNLFEIDWHRDSNIRK